MSETTNKKKSVWSLVLKVIVTVATALAGAFGISSCING
nr:smalltalk protein [uncultured Bacteroides sp.]